jgi:hypothetical protein
MPLKTEIDTREMWHRVRGAFYDSEHHVDGRTYDAFFEHGQWWITCMTTGAQWSVVDAEGGNSRDGFDFERVTDGDDEE